MGGCRSPRARWSTHRDPPPPQETARPKPPRHRIGQRCRLSLGSSERCNPLVFESPPPLRRGRAGLRGANRCRPKNGPSWNFRHGRPVLFLAGPDRCREFLEVTGIVPAACGLPSCRGRLDPALWPLPSAGRCAAAQGLRVPRPVGDVTHHRAFHAFLRSFVKGERVGAALLLAPCLSCRRYYP